MVQAAIQLAPANARYRHSLGVVHEAAEQWGSAADAFERAVEKRPNDVKVRPPWGLAKVGHLCSTPAYCSASVYRTSIPPRCLNITTGSCTAPTVVMTVTTHCRSRP